MKRLRIVLVIWLLVAVACNLPVGESARQNDRENGGVVITPQVAGGAPDQGGGGSSYPTQPETVVQEFLTAYQINPTEMGEYLSAALLASGTDPGQIALLSGQLEGFGIQSAAVLNNPPGARVAVDLQLNGQLFSRVFWLVQESGLWVIERVEE